MTFDYWVMFGGVCRVSHIMHGREGGKEREGEGKREREGRERE